MPHSDAEIRDFPKMNAPIPCNQDHASQDELIGRETNTNVDVVLLQLPFWGVACPPLAHGLLKSFLEEKGFSCAVFDLNSQAYAISGWKYGEHWALKNGYNFCLEREAMLEFYRDHRPLMLSLIGKLVRLNPLIVGCSVQVTSRLLSELFLEDLRQFLPEAKFILGGPEVAHFMKNTETLLKEDYVDGVCQDEGENALLEYVKAVKRNDGSPVPGFVYKHEGSLVYGSESQYIPRLDSLPTPNFDGFFFKTYLDTTSLPTYSSRGCVNKCNYCSAIGFMTNDRWRFRLRSAEKIFEEMIELREKYPQISNFRNFDNISNAKISSLERFCDLMIKSGLNKEVTWNLENAVIRKEMRKPLYEKLKQAGCTLLGYGMETPSVRLLHDVGKTLATKKGVDLPAILREGKEAGLVVSVNVMFGLPTETEDDFNFLMEFLGENKDAFSMINPSLNFCEYYPGSAGHDRPEEHGIDLTNGPLFWKSIDGNSDYLIRMERFEKFCRQSREFGIDNLFDVEELPNKHKLLFEYFVTTDDAEAAKREYELIPEDQRTHELKGKMRFVETQDHTYLESLDSKPLKLGDYVYIGPTLEDVVLNDSTGSILVEEVLGRDVRDSCGTLKLRYRGLRRIAHYCSGLTRIDDRINALILAADQISNAFLNIDSAASQRSTGFDGCSGSVSEGELEIKLLNSGRDLSLSRDGAVPRFVTKITRLFFDITGIREVLKHAEDLAIGVLRDLTSTDGFLSLNWDVDEYENQCRELARKIELCDTHPGPILLSLFGKRLGNFATRSYCRLVGVRLLERRLLAVHMMLELVAMRSRAATSFIASGHQSTIASGHQSTIASGHQSTLQTGLVN